MNSVAMLIFAMPASMLLRTSASGVPEPPCSTSGTSGSASAIAWQRAMSSFGSAL